MHHTRTKTRYGRSRSVNEGHLTLPSVDSVHADSHLHCFRNVCRRFALQIVGIDHAGHHRHVPEKAVRVRQGKIGPHKMNHRSPALQALSLLYSNCRPPPPSTTSPSTTFTSATPFGCRGEWHTTSDPVTADGHTTTDPIRQRSESKRLALFTVTTIAVPPLVRPTLGSIAVITPASSYTNSNRVRSKATPSTESENATVAAPIRCGALHTTWSAATNFARLAVDPNKQLTSPVPPSPDTVAATRVPPATDPDVGLNLCKAGSGRNSKYPSDTPYSIPCVVTATVTRDLAVTRGDMHSTTEDDLTIAVRDTDSPNLQPGSAFTKFEPRTVIVLPPSSHATLGKTDRTTDSPRTTNGTPPLSAPLRSARNVVNVNCPASSSGSSHRISSPDILSVLADCTSPKLQVSPSSNLEPQTVIHTPPFVDPVLGFAAVTSSRTSCKKLTDPRENSTPLLLTDNKTCPPATSPTGTGHLIEVSFITLPTTTTFPNLHLDESEETKFSPSTVTVTPPIEGPWLGITSFGTGSAKYRNARPLSVRFSPLSSSTSTLTMPGGCDGATHTAKSGPIRTTLALLPSKPKRQTDPSP
eukprot:3933726-Rhodomonas_salina.2